MNSVYKELAGKGLIYGLGASLSSVAGFILIPVFIRKLDPAEYGRYSVAEMLLNILLVCFSLGLNVAILIEYPTHPAETVQRFLKAAFGLLLCSAAVLEAVIWGIYLAFGTHLLPSVSARSFELVSLIVLFESTNVFILTIYRARGNAWKYISVSITQLVVSLLVTLVLVVKYHFGGPGILGGRLVADITVLIVLIPEINRLKPVFSISSIKHCLHLGLPLVPATLISTAVMMMPRYLIQMCGTEADVGIFTVSSKAASVLQLLLITPFALAWNVIMIKIAVMPDAQALYSKVVSLYVCVAGFAALSLALCCFTFGHIVGRQSFPLDPWLTFLCLMAIFSSGLSYAVNIGPYVCKKTRKVVPVLIFTGIVAISVGYPLTKWLGTYGAGLALIVTYLAQACGLFYVSQKLYRIRLRSMEIAWIVASLGLTFVAAHWLQLFFGNTYLAGLGAIVAFASVSFVSMYSLKSLPPSTLLNLYARENAP